MMGYERNDRRYGNHPGDRNNDRGTYGAGDRNRSYGYGSRDYRGDNLDDRSNQNRSGYGSEDDRGFFERAGDEVRSWFGDEDAERRRREDLQNEERFGGGYGRDDGYGARSGFQGNRDRSYSRGSSSYSVPSYSGGRSGSHGGNDANRDRGHDPHYSAWRDRQIEALDRDYHDYRRENQARFDSEFHGWRQSRQSQRELLKQVSEHQEVVGSDGQHVGTVDHVRGDTIQLTKSDSAAGGRHHRIPSSWLQTVDEKVTLNKTAEQAKQQWRDDERNSGGGFFRDDGDEGNVNLDRSFRGTY